MKIVDGGKVDEMKRNKMIYANVEPGSKLT